jgi:hypothetical protein
MYFRKDSFTMSLLTNPLIADIIFFMGVGFVQIYEVGLNR